MTNRQVLVMIAGVYSISKQQILMFSQCQSAIILIFISQLSLNNLKNAG